MRRTIGIAFHGNGGTVMTGPCGKPFCPDRHISGPASQCEPPPILWITDGDVIRLSEGRGTAIEGRIIEIHSAKQAAR